MVPYVMSRISARTVAEFDQIHATIQALPEEDLGVMENDEKVELSCHILARAVAQALPWFRLKCIDGQFLQGFNHSWLVTEDAHIIDVYPVGILRGPILIDGQARLLSSQMYKPVVPRSSRARYYKTMFDSAWFASAVLKTSDNVWNTHARIKKSVAV
jgi:hypothetical protein